MPNMSLTQPALPGYGDRVAEFVGLKDTMLHLVDDQRTIYKYIET